MARWYRTHGGRCRVYDYHGSNSDYDSPQRINWQGVDINKQNDLTIVFTLKNRYAQFINNTTLGILPRHIWENVKASSFGLSENNLKPIGSGPYKFSKIRKDTLGNIVALELIAFDKLLSDVRISTALPFNFTTKRGRDHRISEWHRASA